MLYVTGWGNKGHKIGDVFKFCGAQCKKFLYQTAEFANRKPCDHNISEKDVLKCAWH